MSEAFELIVNWESKMEVLPLRHGVTTLAAATAVSAALINFRFRRRLNLKSFAFGVTFGGIVMIPTVSIGLAHYNYILMPQLSGGRICPTCLMTKSALMQGFAGIIYPLFLAPVTCYSFANSYQTVAIPPLHSYGEHFKFYMKIVKPYGKTLMVMLGLQLLLGAGMTYWENMSMLTVMTKLAGMESELKKRMSQEELDALKKDTTGDGILETERMTPRKYIFE